jgi:chromosome partitioning protein
MLRDDRKASLEDIERMSSRAEVALERIRGTLLSPDAQKSPPTFSISQLEHFTGADRNKINYAAKKGGLPEGTMPDGGGRRTWTTGELQQWTKQFRADKLRPKGLAGITISVANFKGGVTKTTTAATLAQGLSLRGHKVLLVDVDPQASLTTLFGLLPGVEIEEEHTLSPLFSGDEVDAKYAVRKTYWPDLDLIPAMTRLYAAEFKLPARQKDTPDFEFWKVLDLGLDPLRDIYDVIVIDTPPSLSYTTINAVMASDGLVVPVPPSTLDFASLSQFWSLYLDIAHSLSELRGDAKRFEFVNILASRVDANDASSRIVRGWLREVYAERVLATEIPRTSIAGAASVGFGTVYDLPKSAASSGTYSRAFDAYEAFVDEIDAQLQSVWAGWREA